MISLRRKLACLLGRMAVRVDPGPSFAFTMGPARRIATPVLDKALADLISGQIVGHGLGGRRPGGSGTEARY